MSHTQDDQDCVDINAPGLLFRPKRFTLQQLKADAPPDGALRPPWRLGYAIGKRDPDAPVTAVVLQRLLEAHGFEPVHPNDANLFWTGQHAKPPMLARLHEFQKINHFPRTIEITRKDMLVRSTTWE